jgi:hypothetical protein
MLESIREFHGWLQRTLVFEGGWHHGEGSAESQAPWYLWVPLVASPGGTAAAPFAVDWEALHAPLMPWGPQVTQPADPHSGLTEEWNDVAWGTWSG